MMRFSKFLKIEAEIVVARYTLLSDETKSSVEPVILLSPEFARKSGINRGDVVEVEREGRSVKLRVEFSKNAPENGGLIPNGVYASYLANFSCFKRFKANIELAEGDVTKPEEIIAKIEHAG